MKYLYKCLCLAITQSRDFWNTISIIIAFKSLHQDFDIITANLLKMGNKSINEIQSILQLKEVKNLKKQANGDNGDLAMVFIDKDRGISSKRKINSNNECYDCYKLGYFGRDFFLPNKKLNKSTQQYRREDLRK